MNAPAQESITDTHVQICLNMRSMLPFITNINLELRTKYRFVKSRINRLSSVREKNIRKYMLEYALGPRPN